MFKSFKAICLGLALAGAGLAVSAPAHANRPIVVDSDPNAANETAFAGCTLGAPCQPLFDLGVSAFDLNGLGKVYVYGEGIVSLGAPLPGTASLTRGTASFGNGTWFAPGLGAPLMIKAHQDDDDNNRWFDWLDAGGNIVFELEFVGTKPCASPNCYTGAYAGFGPFWNPQDNDLGDFGITFNGPGRGLEAFNLVVPSPVEQQQFPPCGDANVTSLPQGALLLGLVCSAHYNNELTRLPGLGAPEPATWALLLGGFALVGSALRRRRLQRA